MDAFMKKAILDYLPAIELEVETMLAEWKPGTVRDIARDMTDFMLRLTSSILFGIEDTDVAYKIGKMIDHWVHLNHELGWEPLWLIRQLQDVTASCSSSQTTWKPRSWV